MTYDSGDYARSMDRALALADWKTFRQAPARSRKRAASCAASASPTTSRSPAARRANASKVDVQPEAASRSRSARCRAARATRRASRNASANGSASTFDSIRLDPGRHRHRAGRRRLAFRPLDADGRRRHGQGVGGDHRRRHAASPRTCSRPTGRYRVRRRPLHREGHRPLDRHVRGGARGARAQRPAGGAARAARGDATRSIRMAAFPFGAHVCEVEIDPDTGTSRSCATPRSTTSAARSIR